MAATSYLDHCIHIYLTEVARLLWGDSKEALWLLRLLYEFLGTPDQIKSMKSHWSHLKAIVQWPSDITYDWVVAYSLAICIKTSLISNFLNPTPLRRAKKKSVEITLLPAYAIICYYILPYIYNLTNLGTANTNMPQAICDLSFRWWVRLFVSS